MPYYYPDYRPSVATTAAVQLWTVRLWLTVSGADHGGEHGPGNSQTEWEGDNDHALWLPHPQGVPSVRSNQTPQCSKYRHMRQTDYIWSVNCSCDMSGTHLVYNASFKSHIVYLHMKRSSIIDCIPVVNVSVSWHKYWLDQHFHYSFTEYTYVICHVYRVTSYKLGHVDFHASTTCSLRNRS